MEKLITDDLDALLDILPPHVRQPLCQQPDLSELLEVILETFRPHREERERLLADAGHIRQVLRQGAEKARAEAEITIKKVREAVGVNY